ncbi:MAG: ATP-binding protein [Promethearchaeota archaeon]
MLEQLEISEKKNRHFISSIKEGYYEINLKGDYEYVNIALCDILGFNIEEIYNINVRNQVDNDTKALFIKTFQKLVEKEEDGITIYYNFTKKNGDRIYLENTIYLRYDENGEIIGFTGLMRDQTKKKAMDDFMEELSEFLESEVQERTKELQESLKEKQKYLDEIIKSSQFKTNFMATMSHELRTPLNAIIGFTDLLLERMLGTISDLQEDYILDIKSSAELQLEMINGILDISKIEAGQINLDIQEFSLNYVLESVISSFKIQLDEKKLLLTKSNFNKDVKIKADPVRFKEIISNLLSNAIKYTIEGTIGIIFQETEQEWIFKIKDTGIGIAEEDHDLIFKEFKRVESDYVKSIQGSGLGLSLIKRLINLHGGNIWFESQLGKGSTFTFAIPKNREN